MPHKATATKKKSLRKNKNSPVEDHVDEQFDIIPKKISKPIEIDEPEVLLGHEEKPLAEDEVLDENKDEDAAEDAIGLDDEEINPFGDKWEE